MRLIDADELKKKAKLRGHCVSPLVTAHHMCVDVHDIDNAPTINPEDLRPKGKWIGLEYDGYADGNPVYDLWECSNCGNEEKGEDVPEQNPFCRCCGAKMEE